MNYPEWADRQLMIDLRNKIAKCYKNKDGSIFYVEPGFYKAFEALKNIYPDRIDDVIINILFLLNFGVLLSAAFLYKFEFVSQNPSNDKFLFIYFSDMFLTKFNKILLVRGSKKQSS